MVVDLISTSEVHVTMAIEDRLGKKTVDRLVGELSKTGKVGLRRVTYIGAVTNVEAGDATS